MKFKAEPESNFIFILLVISVVIIFSSKRLGDRHQYQLGSKKKLRKHFLSSIYL